MPRFTLRTLTETVQAESEAVKRERLDLDLDLGVALDLDASTSGIRAEGSPNASTRVASRDRGQASPRAPA
jgi:hypothetical protein